MVPSCLTIYQRRFGDQTKVTRCGKKSCLDLYPVYPISYVPSYSYIKYNINKAVLPVENTQLLPFTSTVSNISPQSMTFRPAGLSRDPHGIGWKTASPYIIHRNKGQCMQTHLLLVWFQSGILIRNIWNLARSMQKLL